MASIQGGSDIERQSDETFQLFCSPCKRKERNKEADKFCTDCNDYYCNDCVKFHEDIPFLSGHKILDKCQAIKETGKSLPAVPTERCEGHRFKVVDMYCQNHDDVGCYTCMAVDHRSCKDIFDIPEFLQNNQTRIDAKEIQEELMTAKGRLKETLDLCKRDKDRLLKGQEEALHQVREFRKQIDTRLDILERNSIASIEQKYTVLIEKISDEIKVLESSQTEVVSSEDKLTSSESNISQVFVASKMGKRVAESSAKYRDDITTGKHKADIEFKKDKKLLAFLAEYDTLGKLRQSNDLYQVKAKKTYNVRHHSDEKACTISSACVLDDGSIILADKSNKKLKRIDSSYANIDVCDLPNPPYEVCAVNKQDVAAISSGCKNIFYISVERNMKKTKEIDTDHSCWGIASANDNFYVADSNTSVFIYSMSGTKIKQYTRDQTGESLFKSIYSITVSTDGTLIYVADNAYGVVILRGDGILQGKYNCSELENARRVCLLEDGSFLASGYSNNCILQFSPDGEKLGNMLSSDSANEKCQAICFDKGQCRLLVGRTNKDAIDIYEL